MSLSIEPPHKETELASILVEQMRLQGLISDRQPKFLCTSKGHSLELPDFVFAQLVEILKLIAQGKAVTLIPTDAELSTQEAADLLNVSRPYFISLLEAKEIPFRTVGRYRRVRHQDILSYQQKLEEKRKSAMDELVSQAQELKMGY